MAEPGIGHNQGPDYWRELAERCADELNGTCKSVHELSEPEYVAGLDNMVFCARLDELVMECSVCNWWVEPSELAEDTDDVICLECKDC